MTGSRETPNELIEIILEGGYRLTESKADFDCPIKRLVIAPDLSGGVKDLLDSAGIAGRLALVCDPNTYDALGQRLATKLPNADVVVIEKPKADEATIASLTDRTRHADLLIAVGSGTLNDLCKYVSHQRERPYAVFPTAPSMNGYATATASISRDGEKLSLPAAPPVGVFVDLVVQANAPWRLIQAGVGDSLCRGTAQVDWLLSHRLKGTNYMREPFELQTEAEADLLKRAGQLAERDLAAIEALVHLLVLGGLGMLIAGTSQPGSQGEHLISHYIDRYADPHPGTLHGEQVGLATWTMANLQQTMLTEPSPPVLGDAAAPYQELETLWPSLTAELNETALPLDDLKEAFEATGVAMDSDGLGIDRDFYGEAIRNARKLRDRYTMLDFAADMDRLDPFVDKHLRVMRPSA